MKTLLLTILITLSSKSLLADVPNAFIPKELSSMEITVAYISCRETAHQPAQYSQWTSVYSKNPDWKIDLYCSCMADSYRIHRKLNLSDVPSCMAFASNDGK